MSSLSSDLHQNPSRLSGEKAPSSIEVIRRARQLDFVEQKLPGLRLRIGEFLVIPYLRTAHGEANTGISSGLYAQTIRNFDDGCRHAHALAVLLNLRREFGGWLSPENEERCFTHVRELITFWKLAISHACEAHTIAYGIISRAQPEILFAANLGSETIGGDHSVLNAVYATRKARIHAELDTLGGAIAHNTRAILCDLNLLTHFGVADEITVKGADQPKAILCSPTLATHVISRLSDSMLTVQRLVTERLVQQMFIPAQNRTGGEFYPGSLAECKKLIPQVIVEVQSGGEIHFALQYDRRIKAIISEFFSQLGEALHGVHEYISHDCGSFGAETVDSGEIETVRFNLEYTNSERTADSEPEKVACFEVVEESSRLPQYNLSLSRYHALFTSRHVFTTRLGIELPYTAVFPNEMLHRRGDLLHFLNNLPFLQQCVEELDPEKRWTVAPFFRSLDGSDAKRELMYMITSSSEVAISALRVEPVEDVIRARLIGRYAPFISSQRPSTPFMFQISDQLLNQSPNLKDLLLKIFKLGTPQQAAFCHWSSNKYSDAQHYERVLAYLYDVLLALGSQYPKEQLSFRIATCSSTAHNYSYLCLILTDTISIHRSNGELVGRIGCYELDNAPKRNTHFRVWYPTADGLRSLRQRLHTVMTRFKSQRPSKAPTVKEVNTALTESGINLGTDEVRIIYDPKAYSTDVDGHASAERMFDKIIGNPYLSARDTHHGVLHFYKMPRHLVFS